MALNNRDYKVITSISSPQDGNQENVFYYAANNDTDAQSLESVFLTDVALEIAGVIPSTSTIYRVRVQNMVDLSDFTDTAITLPGERAGGTMPVFNVAAFTYTPDTRAVASGRKMIGPLSESDVSNGLPTPTFATLLTALANRFSQTIVNGGVSFFPRIMKTEKQPCAECKSGFRYVPITSYPVQSVSFRKIGHLTSRPSS